MRHSIYNYKFLDYIVSFKAKKALFFEERKTIWSHNMWFNIVYDDHLNCYMNTMWQMTALHETNQFCYLSERV